MARVGFREKSVVYRENRPVSIDVGLPQVVADVVWESVSFHSHSSALEHRHATLVQSFAVCERKTDLGK